MKFDILLIGLVLSFAMGCNYNHVKSNADANSSIPNSSATSLSVSSNYAAINSSILTPECLRCHSSSTGSQGGLSLDNYQQVRSKISQIYYRTIEKKDMPPSSLKPEQLAMLKTWLEAGGPEKSSSSYSGPIQGPITWDVIQKQVLAGSCLDCHSGTNPEAHLSLDNFESVKKNISLIFEKSVIEQTMPLEPYPAMTEFQKQALMKWISQGMPN